MDMMLVTGSDPWDPQDPQANIQTQSASQSLQAKLRPARLTPPRVKAAER
jgi:hypothetical protein